ncbi:MAG TPA: DUF86 domain-containing protein [Polyangiaceae bacterium]|jgi:uncharacterized protein YutE (UPF0331/DUF86 family)
MVNRDLVAAKLTELSDRVARIRARAKATADELASDRDALDLVSFNLMLAVQLCADIASHLIADEAWPPAPNLATSFTRLEERGVLSDSTAEALRRAVGLRNIVAHGYQGADIAAIFQAATRGIADLEAFARELARWVTARGE